MNSLVAPKNACSEVTAEDMLRALAAQACGLDSQRLACAWERLESLTMPEHALGRLMDIAAQISAIQNTTHPAIRAKEVHCYGADHGVAMHAVSPYPIEVTAQMIDNAVRGGAGVGALAKTFGIDVRGFDVGVATPLCPDTEVVRHPFGHGTNDITSESAMERETCARVMLYAIEQVRIAHKDRSVDIIGMGEVGIGNTTPASALIARITGSPIEQVTGPGSGLNAAGVERKIKVIEQIHATHHRVDPADGLGLMAAMGGFEIAAMAGTALGGAIYGVPIVLDGVISTAAALIACNIAPVTRDYLIASHKSQEPGHQFALSALGLRHSVDLDMRLGEGSGAVFGIAIADAACHMMSFMTTFAEAGVSNKVDD